MNFTDIHFIFLFLPVMVLLNRFLPEKYKKIVLLIGSLVFYTIGTYQYMVWAVVALLAMTGVQFMLHCAEKRIACKKKFSCYAIKTAMVALPVILLVGCKALDLMPIGISFFVFQLIALQVDLWQEKTRTSLSPVDFFGFLFMFPKLTMGPIARYRETVYGKVDIEKGLRLFTVGMALKVILSDQIATLWNAVSVSGATGITLPTAWLGAFAYTMELYFDFWGYSLMAMGCGYMLGITIPENFNNPYQSVTVGEFWKRWHITLGKWFKDYIYIPLGGNRKGSLRTAGNLLVVWLLTGIWHGNGWNFVVWGLTLYGFILLERYTPIKLLKDSKKKGVRWLGHIYIWIVMPVSWMLFSHEDLSAGLRYIATMFGMRGSAGEHTADQFLRYLQTYWYWLLIGLLLLTPYPARWFKKYQKKKLMVIPLLILFWFSILLVFRGAGNSFMYYQF